MEESQNRLRGQLPERNNTENDRWGVLYPKGFIWPRLPRARDFDVTIDWNYLHVSSLMQAKTIVGVTWCRRKKSPDSDGPPCEPLLHSSQMAVAVYRTPTHTRVYVDTFRGRLSSEHIQPLLCLGFKHSIQLSPSKPARRKN